MSDWADYRQNRQIRDLQDDIAGLSALSGRLSSQNHRLQSRLAQLSGSLEQRLNRLSASFDAFVELSDLRVDLSLFGPENLARYQARRLLASLADPSGTGAAAPPPVTAEQPDVPGYWLVPATKAFTASADGAAEYALARQRDPHRSAVFRLLLAALSDRPAPAGLLAEALAELPAPLGQDRRTLWLLAADGAFGPSGRDTVQARLTRAVAELDTSERAQEEAAWRGFVHSLASDQARTVRDLSGTRLKALEGQLSAAKRLRALRDWCAAAVELPAPDADRPERPSAAADDARRTLELLIEEGSEAEAPLLARAAELRAVIEAGGASGAVPADWRRPVGPPMDLLRADARQTERPHRRAIAVRASAPLIGAVAAELAEAATARTTAEAELAFSGLRLTVTRDGTRGNDLAMAEQELNSRTTVSPVPRRVCLAAAGLAVLLTLVGLVTAEPTAYVGTVLAAGAAAIAFVRDRMDRKDAVETADYNRRRLHQQTEQAAAALRDLDDRSREAREAAPADLAAIRTTLGLSPGFPSSATLLTP
ncbi:hypothetical protein [Allonocardiopsis opalescens]|uniref:Uncharacterized protein n=1 Tax=Allonocardiopsis opalescens TaxID=1144618 RepID=A0A2T0Q9V1_9ACTN|nr:hypothetical protein [Allonocardiopsis opalescens]PRY00592.1 hypothetical protein CLV72_102223 [Allonocardiopsis opalescens]